MIQKYEAQIASSRQHFEQHPAVRKVCHDEIDSKTLEAFLIYFSALGAGMTEPVGRWIRRAGERCGTLGLSGLAYGVVGHSERGSLLADCPVPSEPRPFGGIVRSEYQPLPARGSRLAALKQVPHPSPSRLTGHGDVASAAG